MESIKELLAQRAQLRSLFQKLTLMKTYSDLTKVREVEDAIRDLFCRPLDLTPAEAPSAKPLIDLLLVIFTSRFRNVTDFAKPYEALDYNGTWSDFPMPVRKRILDLVGPIDTSPAVIDALG